MKALDTEILLEYLVDGHADSNQTDLFFHSASESEIYFLSNIVLHEVVKSFEDNVKFDKSDILTVLKALMSNSQIRFENREIISEAIEMYTMSRDTFSSCLKSVVNTAFQMSNLELLQKERSPQKAHQRLPIS